jgi:valyl-tRNA synthetase
MELDQTYEPRRLESHWAQWWVETGIFHADAKAPGPRFSLAIPPPNVTGSMHLEHRLEHSLIDSAIRWRRMCDYNTLFLPSVDHAGIARQMLVERSLAAEGVTDND